MTKRAIHVAMSLVLLSQSPVVALAADSPSMNFKMYNNDEPASSKQAASETGASETGTNSNNDDSIWTEAQSTPEANSAQDILKPEIPQPDAETKSVNIDSSTTGSNTTKVETDLSNESAEPTAGVSSSSSSGSANSEGDTKVLQGYIRVVPTGTKIPIIMDSAVDSDTSQEGDEFSARTAEDLEIDGSTVVPAGSIIKGRIAGLNAPKHLSRSGSVALKFDTVTTPDNRQIPLVANIVARGGVVHAKRGLKDIAIDTGTVALPTAIGLGIGLLAGGANNSSSSSDDNGIGRAGGAVIGAGIGLAVGVIILCAKKGKKVDVRPGDELRIELAEDLRMPM